MNTTQTPPTCALCGFLIDLREARTNSPIDGGMVHAACLEQAEAEVKATPILAPDAIQQAETRLLRAVEAHANSALELERLEHERETLAAAIRETETRHAAQLAEAKEAVTHFQQLHKELVAARAR